MRTNFYLYLGNPQYAATCSAEAQKDLERGLELNPQAPYAHPLLSGVLRHEEKPQEALEEIALEPSAWARLTGQAIAYHALGREADSDAALAGLMAKLPNDSALSDR